VTLFRASRGAWAFRVTISLFALLGAPLHSAAAQSPTTDRLRAGFVSPPPQARLRCYWWWLNGNTTEETITNDLTEMSRKGFGGVLLVDANGSNQLDNDNVPAGPLFGSPAWVRLYLHALKVAASLHLEVTLNATSGWNLGGPDVTPEQASKLLTWSRTNVTDGRAFDAALPLPPITNNFYRQIAVLAYPLAHGVALPGEPASHRSAIRSLKLKSGAIEGGISMEPTEALLTDVAATAGEQDTTLTSVIDLTAQVDASGHLHWQPPSKGAWEILRIGYTDSDARVSTSSGAWQGLAIDYLDRTVFDTYWDHTLAPLLNAARPYLHSTLINLATDSWELGGTNWTARLGGEFRARRGYDPIRYLPIVAGRIVDDRATSNRFLNDLRRTVGDLVTDHYDHFAARAHAYGLGLQCESGGPHVAPLDALETFRSSAFPQAEYWAQSTEHRRTDGERYFVKEAASAANIYGKPFAADEGMTSIGPHWSESPATDLKPSFDQALTEGMNRLVWHQFTSSPAQFGLPGNEFFAGTHMNPNVTWWNQSGAFFDYLNRSQFLLQQGHAFNDVLYFYGDEVPNFIRLKHDDPARILPGFDYDGTSEDALLHSLTIRGGAIATPAGNRYRLLMLPLGRAMSLAALEHIATYIHQGGAVAGLPPLGPTGNVDAAQAARFAALTRSIWPDCAPGEHSYGAGKVICTVSGRDALRALNMVPDFDDPSSQLDYIHRADATRDIYFVRNTTARQVDSVAAFRIGDHKPELWDPLDGTIEQPKQYQSANGVTRVRLRLAAFGSIFVVFTRSSAAHPSDLTNSEVEPAASPAEVHNLPAAQWTIAFQPGRGAPDGAQALPDFQSWTASSDPGVRYFSGTATYRTTVDIDRTKGQRISLNLTGLHEICTVRVNGKEAGTIWAMPYRLDISNALIPGRNSIELDVTNLWPNRIIGDAQPAVHQTYTRTNIRKYTAASPLLPSGLVGGVFLETTPPADLRH
jgi:alpha-L-rhamnosidase